MRGFCDCCDERADQLFDITRLKEFEEIVKTYQYRTVCQTCYDDLFEELQREKEASDEDE